MNDDISLNNEDQRPAKNLPSLIILLTIGAVLVIIAIIFYPETRLRIENQPSPQVSANSLDPTTIADSIKPSETPGITKTPEPSPTAIAYTNQSQFGVLVLSIREGTDIHLFAYQPFLEEIDNGDFTALPLTRLTTGSHQDITPSINPDGTKIAFSSNRDGQWDIYILDLITGETSRFTRTNTYDGNPTWSPDGQWLAYESYHINNLDIFIQDIEQSVGPIPLTNHPAADYAPNWSGQGRKISYISTRNGTQEIWYADLDSSQQDKSIRIKNLPGRSVKHPTWTADGRYLSWAIVTENGNHSIVTWDSQNPEQDPEIAGTGDWPIWAGAGEILYTLVEDPYSTYLTGYPGIKDNLQVMLPAIKLPGTASGITWSQAFINPESPTPQTKIDPTPLWSPALIFDDGDIEKKELVQVTNIQATYPFFHPDALNTFKPLRKEIRQLIGWDFLSTLENAYKPLADTSEPGISLDWLYSGRGISVNDVPRLANWLVVVREDWGTQTYWRVYLRTNNQQGNQGMPLMEYPWDFNARYSGINSYFESGGAISSYIPDGYWIDFTVVADAYGWKRFPAQSFWQFSETASRYQYFVFTQGLNLRSALLEIYPPDEIQSALGSLNR